MSALDLFPVERAVVLNEADQRFTLRETDFWCRQKAGVEKWDLDVAACEESHLAERFYDMAADGLAQPWFGNVWCNPPYSDIAPWVTRAWLAMETMLACESVSMLIPATRTEQPWWQKWIEPYRDRPQHCAPLRRAGDRTHAFSRLSSYFLPGRTSFGMPGNRDGVGVGSPPFTCVLLVWRRA